MAAATLSHYSGAVPCPFTQGPWALTFCAAKIGSVGILLGPSLHTGLTTPLMSWACCAGMRRDTEQSCTTRIVMLKPVSMLLLTATRSPSAEEFL